MIKPELFFSLLKQNGTNFFSGVPDSLLKDFCLYVDENEKEENHVITANEGGAIAISAGHYMATGNIPLVYMQNSGLGNTINPLTSLVDKKVYRIPILLLIGWRSEPGVKDEPQHTKMGDITLGMLDTLGIPYCLLSDTEDAAQKDIEKAYQTMKDESAPYAIVIKKGIFEEYKGVKSEVGSSHVLSREDALAVVLGKINKEDIVVSTTGKLSRELFELRAKNKSGHHRDFLTVGSMGHASQIALGIALEKKDRKVFCFDGDGAALMHLGGWSTIGEESPKNFIHIVFNNGVHESVGGQKTAGFFINFQDIAKGCKYQTTHCADNEEGISTALKTIQTLNGPHLLEIRINKNSRKDLGRPTISPQDNRKDFENFIRS